MSLSYELLPPRGTKFNDLYSIADVLQDIDAITVTDNPVSNLRASSVLYALLAREKLHRNNIIPNITCRDKNLLALQSELLSADIHGFRNIFLVTGDAPVDKNCFKPVWELNSTELCRVAKNLNLGKALVHGKTVRIDGNTNFEVGGAVVFDRMHEHFTFKKKREAGFDYFISQLIFDADSALNFFYVAEANGDKITKHIQIGLSPASSLKSFRAISSMSGVTVKPSTIEKLENAPNFVEEIVSHLAGVCDTLKSNLSTYSIGFHFMPIGNPEATHKLIGELAK